MQTCNMNLVFELILLTVSIYSGICEFCPAKCLCSMDNFGRKVLHCHGGNIKDLYSLLKDDIKKKYEIIKITAQKSNPNNLELGPLFRSYQYLIELHITHSSLSIIGNRTFSRMFQMRVLNLSHNCLTRLNSESFHDLSNLEELFLNNNQITSIPSGSFSLLKRLKILSLAYNKLQELSTLIFKNLDYLQSLDLSGNELTVLNPIVFENIRHLRIFRCSHCGLLHVNQTSPPRFKNDKARNLFDILSHLEELDFRNNKITVLESEQFYSLQNLQVLLLNGNKLKIIPKNAFVGHNFRILELGENSIYRISQHAFHQVSIMELDLSSNILESLDWNMLQEISAGMQVLDVSDNPFGETGLGNSLSLFGDLRLLSVADSGLRAINPSFFESLTYLHTLNLSGNSLSSIPSELFEFLPKLRFLDLSRNLFHGLNNKILSYFSTLNVVYLQRNPWICDECNILKLVHWLRKHEQYLHACDVGTSGISCLKCAAPYSNLGLAVQKLEDFQIGTCDISEEPSVAKILSRPDSLTGIIIACTVTIILCLAAFIVFCFHVRHSAHYYTNEGKQQMMDNSFIPLVSVGKRATIATIEEFNKDDILFRDDFKNGEVEQNGAVPNGILFKH